MTDRGRLSQIASKVQAFLSAYGAFFLLQGGLPTACLLAATLVDPVTGIGGLLGLLGVHAARAVGVEPRADDLDRINGLLLGLVVGATFHSWPLMLLAGPVAALATAFLASEVEARALPLLALPFATAGLGLWWIASSLAVPVAQPHPYGVSVTLPPPLTVYLQSLGGIYLSPYPVSGLLVLLALLSRSRYLALLSVLGFACSELCWASFGALRWGTTSVVGGTGAIVAILLVAGLMTAPSLTSVLLGMLSAVLASLAYLALVGPLHIVGVPPLAFPFILATWIAIRGFRSRRDVAWLLRPQLPEESSEAVRLSMARGYGDASVPLAAPFEGAWMVYQGFDGPHTHQGLYRYGVDFVKTLCERSFRGTGTQLGDYYAYDQVVHSPASGIVVALRDDLPDHAPGSVDLEHRFGNHLIIDVGEGLHVVLAHLRQASLQVAKGQRVTVGQPLAACGNSGRSPQPHLHMHVQKGVCLGVATLPFHLSGLQVDGGYLLRWKPVAGIVVEGPRADPTLVDGLHLPVGKRLVFCCEESARPNSIITLTVELDPAGTFWLKSESGARLAFHQSSTALTFYARCSKREPVLDALALALGVTVLVEGPCYWTDRSPIRLITGAPSAPLWRPLGHSTYRRHRSSSTEWLQFAEHSTSVSKEPVLTSRAVLHSQLGLRELILWKGGETRLRARLVGVGLSQDVGVPGWLEGCCDAGPLIPAGEPLALLGEPTRKLTQGMSPMGGPNCSPK